MNNDPQAILNQERFEAWLFSQPGDRVIESGDGSKCFLCSFVKETTSLKPYFHAWDQWRPSGDTTFYAPESLLLPKWATILIDPVWLNKNGTRMTVARMQQRYIELFGPVDTQPLNLATVPAPSVQPLSQPQPAPSAVGGGQP